MSAVSSGSLGRGLLRVLGRRLRLGVPGATVLPQAPSSWQNSRLTAPQGFAAFPWEPFTSERSGQPGPAGLPLPQAAGVTVSSVTVAGVTVAGVTVAGSWGDFGPRPASSAGDRGGVRPLRLRPLRCPLVCRSVRLPAEGSLHPRWHPASVLHEVLHRGNARELVSQVSTEPPAGRDRGAGPRPQTLGGGDSLRLRAGDPQGSGRAGVSRL